MRYSGIIALGMGNMALAQNSTFTPPPTNPEPAPGVPDNNARHPFQIGDFQFYGCTKSEQNHPTFSLIASTQSMSLGFCAASCPTRFMGVAETDCYCGDEVDSSEIQVTDEEECSSVCPGDESQLCGGTGNALRLARRQAVPISARLSMYIRIRDPADDGGDGDGDGDGDGNGDGDNDDGDNDDGFITGVPTPPETITTTITTCPPEVPNCPIGHETVYTITSTFCPEPTPMPYPKKAILCYGDYCVPQLPDCHGSHCEKHRVVCRDDLCYPEKCPKGEEHHANKLVICEGDECNYSKCEGEDCKNKLLCYGDECIREKCYGEECLKKLVCEGEECDHQECIGDDCFIEEICEGEHCVPTPPCGGEGEEVCPIPSPPGPAPCVGPQCPCEGIHCPPTASPTPQPPVGGEGEVCVGAECPAQPISPPVAGSEKQLPALGMGLLAGLAFFL